MIKKSILAALLAVFSLAAPAWADTLVDNVEGVTVDATGGIDHFTGLHIVETMDTGDTVAH